MKLKHIYLGFFLILCSVFVFIILYKNSDYKRIKITPYLSTDGTRLIDHGEMYTFTGFNMFQIATLPGHNAGCGGYVSDIDGIFKTMRPNGMIRIWAWQGSMTINPSTKQLDWTGVDRVLNAAKKYKQRVIISLAAQTGECDDQHWKDSQWYQGGYKNVYNQTGLTPLSYWDYVQKIVDHYKMSQVIAMWELVNEPETSDCMGYTGVACSQHQVCPDHRQAAIILRHFFDVVGAKVKTTDPNHLIESGLIGTGQCGSDNANYLYVHQSPVIDVASYHDYNDDTKSMPGDQWNGLAMRLSQTKSINKPLIIGEVGMIASQTGGTCMPLNQRVKNMKAKMDTMFSAGIGGFMPWNRSAYPDSSCNFDVRNNDPLISLINTYTLK